jgi:hypothetical protein
MFKRTLNGRSYLVETFHSPEELSSDFRLEIEFARRQELLAFKKDPNGDYRVITRPIRVAKGRKTPLYIPIWNEQIVFSGVKPGKSYLLIHEEENHSVTEVRVIKEGDKEYDSILTA